MNISASVKPAVWGAVGGAIVAMVIGFVWGGWVTGKTAGEMAAESAEMAIVQAFAPLCVAKAEQQPAQLVLLKKTNDWERNEFVVESGWVANVSEKYRSAVADSCASTVVEGMDAKPTS
jgi:alpha/beta superfamily hydrolase